MLEWGHFQYKRPNDQILISQEPSWPWIYKEVLYFISDAFWFPFSPWAPGFPCLDIGALDPRIHNPFLSEEKGWFCCCCSATSPGLGPVSTLALRQPVQCNVLERRGPNCYQSSSEEKKWCELSSQLKGKHDFYLVLNVSFVFTNYKYFWYKEI